MEDVLCLLALAVAHLPLCLQWGDGPICSWLALLWYSYNPSFCEQVRLCLKLELFASKFSNPPTLAIPPFGLLSHVSSLRLSSGHSGPVLTLSMQPAPPCSAPACWWPTQASGLLLHRELWLGEYSVIFFFSPSCLCCPLRFQNPTDPLGRGFLDVWKPLHFHNSLPGTGLHP